MSSEYEWNLLIAASLYDYKQKSFEFYRYRGLI